MGPAGAGLTGWPRRVHCRPACPTVGLRGPEAPREAGMRRSFCRSPKAALLWGLLLFAGVQLGLAVAMESWRPECRDPEYATKCRRLRQRLREEPSRPLVVVLG